MIPLRDPGKNAANWREDLDRYRAALARERELFPDTHPLVARWHRRIEQVELALEHYDARHPA
jgi:hypothetical protein